MERAVARHHRWGAGAVSTSTVWSSGLLIHSTEAEHAVLSASRARNRLEGCDLGRSPSSHRIVQDLIDTSFLFEHGLGKADEV